MSGVSGIKIDGRTSPAARLCNPSHSSHRLGDEISAMFYGCSETAKFELVMNRYV